MAQSSFPWTDGTGDGGSYAANTWDNIYEKLFITDQAASEGVLKGDGSELAVSGTSSPLDIGTGSAVVKGKIYISTAAETIVVPTPSAQTRIDRIVLQADFTAQTVRIARHAGSEGGAAPTLTQTDGTTWEISLAQASITTGGVITVTDERTFAHYGTEVNTAMIADDAVTNAKIGALAVDTTEIAAGAVTPAKMTAYSVGCFVWFIGGTLSTGTNKTGMKYRIDGNETFTGWDMVASTAPTGADLIVDVNLSGTTLFTTQANRPKLPDGNTYQSGGAPDVTTGSDGDRLNLDVDQVGSSVAGADVTVQLWYKKPLV